MNRGGGALRPCPVCPARWACSFPFLIASVSGSSALGLASVTVSSCLGCPPLLLFLGSCFPPFCLFCLLGLWLLFGLWLLPWFLRVLSFVLPPVPWWFLVPSFPLGSSRWVLVGSSSCLPSLVLVLVLVAPCGSASAPVSLALVAACALVPAFLVPGCPRVGPVLLVVGRRLGFSVCLRGSISVLFLRLLIEPMVRARLRFLLGPYNALPHAFGTEWDRVESVLHLTGYPCHSSYQPYLSIVCVSIFFLFLRTPIGGWRGNRRDRAGSQSKCATLGGFYQIIYI